MKNKSLLALLLAVFAGAILAGDADAGWFDKEKKEDQATRSHRYDAFPTMSFYTGTLRKATFSGWQLGEVMLQFIPGSKVTGYGGEGAFLREGQEVLIMGHLEEEGIVAWRVRVMESDWKITRDSSRDDKITWSTSDPTVGESPTTE